MPVFANNDQPAELKKSSQETPDPKDKPKKEYLLILQFPSAYKKLPDFEEQLEKAVDYCSTHHPRYVFLFNKNFQGRSYYEKAIEKSAWTAAKRYPWVAFEFINRFTGRYYTEDVLKRAANHNDTPAFFHYTRYKNQVWRKNILLVAVEHKPRHAFMYLKYYKDQPWALEVIIRAVEILFKAKSAIHVNFAFNFPLRNPKHPFSKAILKKSAQLRPDLFAKRFDEIKKVFPEEAEAIRKQMTLNLDHANARAITKP